MSKAAYEALGGVEGAIGRQADRVFDQLGFGEEEAKQTLGEVFRELVQVDDSGVATRQRAALARICRSEAADRLVKAFSHRSARLLVCDEAERSP